MQVRGVYGVLLESKADRWHAQRIALAESIQNLAAFYQAMQALPRSTSTADLSEWFEHLIDQVRHLLRTSNLLGAEYLPCRHTPVTQHPSERAHYGSIFSRQP